MKAKTKITKKLINEVLRRFPWEEAARLYRLMGWMWDFEGTLKIPKKSDLRNYGRELLEDMRDGGSFCESGGLRATRKQDVLSLEFIALGSSALIPGEKK